MLRDPLARFLSSYYFILRRPLHPLHRKLKKERLGVEDYLRLTPHRQNFQCQLIAGLKDAVPNDEHILEMAKDHLTNSFSVVGISERFEESLLLIAKTFGWEVPFYENRKVSKNRSPVDAASLEMIREHNRLDLELYEFGKKLFEENLRQKQELVREGLAALQAMPRPGTLESFYNSSLSAGRFFLSKVASVV